MIRRLSALVVAGAALTVGAAQAAEPAPTVESTRYTFAASSPAAKGSGAGELGAKLARGGRGVVRVVAGKARLTAAVRRWEVRVDGARVMLTLRLEASAVRGAQACPVGAGGVVTLVDDADDPSSDSVHVRFAGARCAAFARSWSGGEGDSARVRIDVVFADA